ncbi:MAG: NAD(P)(+) transhydrogenase (Re/Si-specific) subunit alpha, partial [Betaproteobacteria bacterium]|nr:NAD(P)(+) transhydrogenase (Re/Si-specific) subunit alpha [Betaproteobacteria bacterium]
MALIIGIPREVHSGERRVAATPDTATQLMKLGFKVALEAGAGAGSHLSDEAYAAVGVDIAPNARALWSSADIVIKVRPPEG